MFTSKSEGIAFGKHARPGGMMPYEVTVSVLQARNLLAKDITGTSDPYPPEKTKVIKKNLTPKWNETFTFRPNYLDCILAVSVWDHNLIQAHSFMGVVNIELTELHFLATSSKGSSGSLKDQLNENENDDDDDDDNDIDSMVEKESETSNTEKGDGNNGVLFSIKKWFPLRKSKHKKYGKQSAGGEIELKVKVRRVSKALIIGHYNFESLNSKSLLQDISGFSNHASLINVGTRENIIMGSWGGIFNGFNYAECDTNPLRGLHEFSISCWFKTDDPSRDMTIFSTLSSLPQSEEENASSLNKSIFSGISVGTRAIQFYDKKGYSIIKEEDASEKTVVDDIYFKDEEAMLNASNQATNSNESKNVGGTSEENEEDESFNRSDRFKKDQWNYFCLIYTGRKMKEFVNGALVDEKSCTGKPVGDGRKLQIGAFADELTFNGFKGELAEVMILNHALSNKDVETIFNHQIKKMNRKTKSKKK